MKESSNYVEFNVIFEEGPYYGAKVYDILKLVAVKRNWPLKHHGPRVSACKRKVCWRISDAMNKSVFSSRNGYSKHELYQADPIATASVFHSANPDVEFLYALPPNVSLRSLKTCNYSTLNDIYSYFRKIELSKVFSRSTENSEVFLNVAKEIGHNKRYLIEKRRFVLGCWPSKVFDSKEDSRARYAEVVEDGYKMQKNLEYSFDAGYDSLPQAILATTVEDGIAEVYKEKNLNIVDEAKVCNANSAYSSLLAKFDKVSY